MDDKADNQMNNTAPTPELQSRGPPRADAIVFMARTRRTSSEPIFDAGWLFLIAGLMLIASGVMIPATRSLDRAHWRRDRVLLTEMHRLHRLTRHEAYLGAILDEQDAVVYQLAATQLGLVRDGTQVVELVHDGPTARTSVFASLEPSMIELPAFTECGSRLARLANGDLSRLWMLACGAMLVLIGLLPPSVVSRT